jgi:hypothetical protein
VTSLLIVPLQEHHVRALTPQQAQAGQSEAERVHDAMALAQSGSGWALVCEEGVAAIAGVQAQWGGRGVAWCLLSDLAGAHMVPLTRAVRRYLDGLDYARIEMYVDAQFAEGCRWARLLGFKNETPEGMPRFLPNGNTAFMYGRTR